MTDWELPVLASVPALAETLELDLGQLRWLADLRGLERTASSEALRNYRYRLLPRRRGGLARVIEIPKGRTKEIQRWVLREILDHVPAHPAATGFRPGASVRGHAERHCGRDLVIRMDLADFFSSIRRARVRRVFAGLGYRPEVAGALAGLCTNVVPLEVWAALERTADDSDSASERRRRLERMLASPHLPQGAPSSPALANLAAFGLDRRLSGLAAHGAMSYSRYADDLTFSGERMSPGRRRRLVAMVAMIARDEGFQVHEPKTAVHPAGGRQSTCGVVVNTHPNVRRDELDRLRAILHNCVRDGPESQNRAAVPDFAAHLRGRVAWVAGVNPAAGARLLDAFEQIRWPGADPGASSGRPPALPQWGSCPR